MLIECEGCAVRGLACGDCVVTLLLGSAPGRGGQTDERAESAAPGVLVRPEVPVDLDQADRRALRVLADAGLVPRLRHEPRRQAG